MIWNEGYPYSVCENFVSPDTELVSAWRIMKTQKKSNSTSVYQHFISCCQSLGIEDVVPALDRMLTLDYMIADEDRHLNNFGFLRSPETLKWLGFAPIFDSGSALGYDRTAPRIRADRDVTCKPFKNHHFEQLKLISSFDWIEFDALADVENMIREILSAPRALEFVGQDRVEAIVETTGKRIRAIQETAKTHSPVEDFDSVEDDVTENVAQEYTGY